MKTINISNLINNLVIVVTNKDEAIEEMTQRVTSALLKAIDSADKHDGSSRPLGKQSSNKAGANLAGSSRSQSICDK